ncbi:glycosyltransferase WbuB [Collimonas antrihumi]|uniref:glycosyltransferase WbuB n=1 Tax=Collimonas antrihumi TaxID=1940615 RepID=UPI001B8B712A|nr:glycosyltransferase WbuB [Collimonas antrihumi]
MKILLYGINFAPELTGIGKYTGEMAAWLAATGHEVRVVTAPPYYPDWQVWHGYSSTRYTHEVWKGVQVWRAPLWVPKKPSGLKRLIHLASFALGSLPLMLRQLMWRPQVVWVVEPPLFCAPTALCVARLTGARAWLHVQDFEVDAAFALGLLQGGLARRLVTRLERWLMRRFDRVSTISDSMLARASAKGVAAERLVHFPNWIDLDAIQPLTAPSSYRVELGIPADAVVALYSGNMGGKQGLEIMAEAARLLSDQADLHFVFCGNGAGKAELLRLAEGLSNVRFLDLQPMDRLNDLLGLADIHLLPQRADAADLVMPSKLTGMLASGRAVVATAHANTELGRVVQSCGLLVVPGDADAFAVTIGNLARDPLLRKTLGLSGRRHAELHLGMDGILSRFERCCERLCGVTEGI